MFLAEEKEERNLFRNVVYKKRGSRACFVVAERERRQLS